MRLMLGVLLALFLIQANAACDITLTPNTTYDVTAVLQSAAYPHVCLQAGQYSVYSNLALPTGKTIEGLGASRSDTLILSSSSTAISAGNDTTLHNFTLIGPGGASATYGVNIYHKNTVLIWAVAIKQFLINIGVNGSSGVTLADVTLSQNGNLSNGIADPNLYITGSNDVDITYGSVTGRANGPGGDGEISCYNSTLVHVNGTSVIDSGASGLFFVNCDNSSIKNINSIDRANEWGIDVHGSDNMLIQNNVVRWSNFGAIVFEEAQTIGGTPPVNSIGGQIKSNTFTSNRQIAGGFCDGINIDWDPSHVTMSGNTTNRGTLVCQWDVTP